MGAQVKFLPVSSIKRPCCEEWFAITIVLELPTLITSSCALSLATAIIILAADHLQSVIHNFCMRRSWVQGTPTSCSTPGT